MDLTEEQIQRYSRQIVLKEVGGIGQKKLLNSKVTIIGCGGLGSPVAFYLTAAGIGNIKIIDFDTVDLSNLHRQILHFTSDINKKKTQSAYEKLHQLNPDVNIEVVNDLLLPSNIIEILKGSSFVIDGSDNIPTKMLINDACIQLKIPFTIAGVVRFNGQIMTVDPENKTACYRCIFGDITENDPSMSCSQAGVIGFVPGVLGCLEANEALKCILNIGDLLTNQIMYVDLLRNSYDFIEIRRDTKCKACGDDAKDLVEEANYGGLDACDE